jgi:hypothetical protein
MQPATDTEVVGGAVKKEPEEIVVEVDGDGDEEAEKVVKRRRRRRKKTTAWDPHKKRACVDCTKRCARIHGQPASPSALASSSSNARPVPAVPSFFKVMLGYFSEDMVCFLFLYFLFSGLLASISLHVCIVL